MALVSLQELKLAFGGPLIFDQLTLQIEQGEKIALLGRNGSGKTTLMRVITGEQSVDEGEIIYQKGIQIAFLPQEIPSGMKGSVYDVVLAGLGNRVALLRDYYCVTRLIQQDSNADLLKQMDHLQSELDRTDSWVLKQEVDSLLTRMQLNSSDLFETMSGGQKRRVLLAKALVTKPDVLLLDEPTNHLDIDSIVWLEDLLRNYPKTVLFVTHDRTFMSHLSTRIVEIDRGNVFNWTCDYKRFLERKQQVQEIENVKWEKFDKKLAQEEVWIRKGVKARRCRNEGRVKALERMREEKKMQRKEIGQVRLTHQNSPLPGHLVFKVSHVEKKIESSFLIKDFSTHIMRGDRIGIIGPNGCGKTTFLRILLGKIAPDKGKVRLGTNLQILYYDQLREHLNENKTVAENVNDGNETITINGKTKHIIGYLQDFLFTPERARTPVNVLSGGERNRLLLARLFARPSNLIIMDEPTNDLDIETLELLEEILLEYKGTIILVSHDRSFINNVVTSTLVFEGDGEIREYAGGYDDWVIQKKSSEPPEPVKIMKKEKSERNKTKTSFKKLSFKEKYELEGIPDKIDALEIEQKNIYAVLSDPNVYKGDPSEILSLNDQLKIIEKKLQETYERWEYLLEIERFSANS